MFSLLSRGYGTYDGTAKSEPNPNTPPDHKEYFSLDDFHLPAIESSLKKTTNRSQLTRSFHEEQGPRYENKAFKLPTVSNIPSVPLSKTYSTKRGALLLYSETNALPGSPKARKRRRKYKKQQPVKLKTIGDLRDLVLNYRNGGDPLFLALLQKRLSASNKERAVRPGFSPKRYIATLGRNSLQQECWDKLASSGSLRDPALQSYNPFVPAIHSDGSGCELFPGKPQPYSTMSLPPISPSNSMLEGSFQFYKNGMSTGAASMISVNSEEYAPSSRAVSPAESTEGRLLEVEPLPPRREALDPYAMLNEKQKADLLSRLLYQGALESMDSDLERWVAELTELSNMEQEPLPSAGRPRLRHKGNVRSGSLTSVPRLPPIYSAGARLTTPVDSEPEGVSPVEIPTATDDAESKGELDVLDPGAVTLHFNEDESQSNAGRLDKGEVDMEANERTPQAQAADQIGKQRVGHGSDLNGPQGDPETNDVPMATAASARPTAAATHPGTSMTTVVSTDGGEDDDEAVSVAVTSATTSVPPASVAAADVSAAATATVTTPASPAPAPAPASPAASPAAIATSSTPKPGDLATDDSTTGGEAAVTLDTETQDTDAIKAERQQDSTENTTDDSIASLEDVVLDTTELQGVVTDEQVQVIEEGGDGGEDFPTRENQSGEPQTPREEGEVDGETGKDAVSTVDHEEGDVEDEGIGLEGEETDEETSHDVTHGRTDQTGFPAESQRKDSKGSGISARPTDSDEVDPREEKKERSAEGAAEDATPDTDKALSSGDETEGGKNPTDPPPPISLDELHGQAQAVARKVLARPQSGMVFMEDVRNAVTMWADRLSSLLGPPPQPQDTRVSSAGPQRSPASGQRRHQGPPVTKPPVRHRKVSRSAGPSMAFLRNALLISGGDASDLETLRKLPPLRLPSKFDKTSRSRRSSGVVPPGHTYHEPNETDSTSSGPATKSIPFDRVSNSDLQMDIFSFVASEEAAMIERLQAEEIIEDELAQSDEFQAALSAVVSEAKQTVVPVKSTSNLASTSPSGKLKRKPSEKDVKKAASPPFHVPRPTEAKPPPGLNNKQALASEKRKTLQPAKKKSVAKKKGGKAGAKQQKTKPAKSQEKNKSKKEKPADVKTVEAKESEVEVVYEEKPEVVLRVDSETGEMDPEIHVEDPVSAVASTVPSPKESPVPSLPSQKQNTSPTGSSSTHASEVPRLAPRSPEPEVVPEVVPEAEVIKDEEPSKEAEEAAAKQLQRQERAAKRAAERAAAAERRRQEVERKRREKEEAKRRAAEEEERLEKLRQEQEEQMRRRGEERRREREEREAERRRKDEEEAEAERRAKAKLERQKRMRDAWKQKQDEVIAQRKLEEELRREQERIDAELEMARIREEEERLQAMEEWEREELLKKMRQEEELLRQRLKEQKVKEEEEKRLQEEQRQKQADALALLRQQQLQRHLFVASMFKEHHYLALNQRFTRAFTFSYFQLLPWLYLNSLKSPSPILQNVKQKIQPTIVEEVDEEDD